MQSRVIITCAVTGNQTTPEMTPHLPVTPEQIAEACLGAAEAGAASVHIHVRDPKTGRPSMEIDYYRDVMDRIRARNRDLIINLTTGPGGRFVPDPDDPKVAAPGTTLMRPEDRVAHIALLKPDIATLDLNTMNSGKQVVINTPDNVRRMAAVINAAGVKPEIELFDSGDIALCRDLVADGTLKGPILCSVVMGVKYGFQPSPETVLYARGMLPSGTAWTAFGTG
ncbi:3-keto-5-aminohexanoate cleavage protein, partial [Ferrovibrio sp.]|uniref:3-keto-5-aminohexanoate cleavage protein n=1 Tax=Ferrovibrio sp. TaxID=1917215 RepID=UPI002626A953